MLRLYLLRHAKSSWSDPSLHDFDRPLNKRGNKDAPKMGKLIEQRGYQPDRILCSTSCRTKQTLGGIIQGLEGNISLSLLDALYEGNAPDYLVLIRQHAHESRNLMLIGHNTGIQEIALRLADTDNPAAMRDIESKFPTAALAVFDFPVDSWAEITPGTGHLVDFIKPRDLIENPDTELVENPAPTFFRR